MIQLSSLMWTVAIFFALIGFLRGWNRELVATAGIVLALFTVFQFDSFLRGVLLATFARDQVFIIQAGFFGVVVFTIYQAREFRDSRRGDPNVQSGVLGGLVGFLNGYLISGSVWYLLDINEYPLAQFVTAPSPASPSAASLNWIPLVLLGGGTSGTGDILTVAVIILLFFVIVVL